MTNPIKLNNVNVRELSYEESKEIGGGILPVLAAWAAACAVAYYAGYAAHAVYDYFTSDKK